MSALDLRLVALAEARKMNNKAEQQYRGPWKPRALAGGAGPANATKELINGWVYVERDDAGYESGDWPWPVKGTTEEETLL